MQMSYKYGLLLGCFIAALVVANTIASKLLMVGGVVITAGIIAYPLTFLFTDIISEVWGKKVAKYTVWAGLAANIVMVLLYTIAVHLPHAVFWEGQAAFSQVLGAVPRIFIASMLAYLISQTWDIWMFHLIKDKYGSGRLWLRNNISTATSQVIDSVVFLMVAFYGVIPIEQMPGMLLGYVVIKWIIALVDTPLVYLGVAWARKESNHESYYC